MLLGPIVGASLAFGAVATKEAKEVTIGVGATVKSWAITMTSRTI
jgi:hypothetical protein